MTTVLITGGFGYVGGRLAQFLATTVSRDVILGSRRHCEAPDWLPQAQVARTQWGSATELERICAGVDAIVHLAAMNAQDCAADPVAAMDVNAVGTARLLRAAARQGVRRFVYLSTSRVYGDPLSGVVTEDTCPSPVHPYATSHRAAEDAVRSAHRSGEIEGVVIRLSNAFGAPAQKDANCWMLLVNDLCRQAIRTRRMELRSAGRQRRDFIPLADACRAIEHLLELPADELGDGLFNAGGGWAPTILEMTRYVAAHIQVMTGLTPEIVRGEHPADETQEGLDYTITRLVGTGFRASIMDTFDQEVDRLIQFCRAQDN